MFPSNSTSHHHNPLSYSDHSFDFQTNPPSIQESDNQFPSISFSDFSSSPFLDYQFFLNQQQPHDFPEPEQLPNQLLPQVIMNMNMGDGIKKTMVTRKREGKRERHSKINTARGLRDRRMRLSLQVAKRFFHLQDMLGFEKASKTVEWLLNQTREEIKQVAAKTASSTFEYEIGLSSPEEVVLNEIQEEEEEKKQKGVRRRRTKVGSRKISAFNHPLAKVSREKARERARERTKQKMRSKLCELEATNHSLTTQLGFSNF